MGVQYALFMKNILKSLRWKVKLHILASIDNSGAVDIGNNWSICGRIHHVEVKQNFVGELKQAGLVEFQWVSTESNETNMFTENMMGSDHNKHAAKVCGHNKYYSTM